MPTDHLIITSKIIMFNIKTENRQYQTYILEDSQTQSFLEVVPERGGIITQWKVNNQDILYLNQERFTDRQLSVRGGIPILFPICGNLPDNSYEIQGEKYQLKQHGFARDLPWQVIKQDTNNHASLTLTLTNNEETLKVYPFKFVLEFTYLLKGNSLKIIQKFTNNSPTKMPFSIGFHPYFSVDDKNSLSFDIPSHQYQDQQTKEILPFNGSFDFTKDEIDAGFTYLNQQNTSYSDRQKEITVQLNYDPIYSNIVFWTIKGQDYICLEPWSAPRNALNTGDQLIYIEAESHLTAEVEIIVKKI
jgi:galactose mutarotase-like enzyme